MLELVALVLVTLVVLPGGALGQDVVVTSYTFPAGTVAEPVTVTTSAASAVTTVRAVAPVAFFSPTPAVVTERQPLLRPRSIVVRAVPAAVVAAPPAVVTYTHPAVGAP